MSNILLMSSSQTSPNTGNPLNPLPIPPLAAEPESTSTIEAILATPLEPVLLSEEEAAVVDGNVQAHMDVNYQAHDVALVSAKGNGHQQTNGLTASDHHKVNIEESDDHPRKSQSCYSLLNKLYLALAIVCFALFLCAIAFIVANLEYFNGTSDRRSLLNRPYTIGDDFSSPTGTINEPFFNLTHPTKNGIIVVLSRRGASVDNILIPANHQNGSREYRSVVVKGGNENHFGSVRFGFDVPSNTMNMTNQLPLNYPFLNFYQEEWILHADVNKPYRARFVRGLVEIVYQFSLNDPNEFLMTTIVATPVDQQIIVDPTNNIYFNLRGHGNLSTHYLNLSSSNPINIVNGQKVEQDRLIQSQRVDQLTNINNYFYRLDRSGIGKNYMATLSESQTKTILHMFSDHAGVVVDPRGVAVSNENINHATSVPDMRGVRISPRQSPVYQPMSIYGPTLLVYPSQAIHTTWWQFQYEN